MSIAERFGENLRRARREAGMSQEALAFYAALHRTEIGLIERGERTPRIDTFIKLASAVGVEVVCPLFEGITWELGQFEAGRFEVGGTEGGEK